MHELSPEIITKRRQKGLDYLQNSNIHSKPEINFSILSTFNIDLLTPFLVESYDRLEFFGHYYNSGFGQMAQEIINPNSGLYAFNPKDIFLFPSIKDLLAPYFERPSTIVNHEQLVVECTDEIRHYIDILLEKLPDTTVYFILDSPGYTPNSHVLTPNSPDRGQKAINDLSEAFRAFSSISSRVVLVDWQYYSQFIGLNKCFDERLWYLGRMRLSQSGNAHIAELLYQYMAAYRGLVGKVAIVDLDNTLWGGILGEDGLGGIELGNEGIGLAFQDFQRELLKLHDMGVLLAICSKNNDQDVREVFEQHPNMILKEDHFSAVRINWKDKATNIREMAKELRLGLDSFVFFDDNPVERDWVKTALPQVKVPDMPEDPTFYPDFVRKSSLFNRIQLTESDIKRVESYKADRERRKIKATTSNFDDFIASLEQQITIDHLTDLSISRAAQMCQRTNQFNLTTKRYTIAELEKMQNDPNAHVFTLAVQDRFGDSGITGLAILLFENNKAIIDTFLLSCRILGRKVETAFLTFLIKFAAKNGIDLIVGQYIPTAKNQQTESFYSSHNFESQDGMFVMDLTDQNPEYPLQLKIKEPNGA